ncbi:MAG TPA: response regulator [Terriglobales bacterium]|jgi:CheY-like chemotaxis protein|nr:response regulator [Terriglobales bacterium]
MAGNVKVLLVEDNPMVLEMLRQALSPLGSVTCATDGADALLKAIDDPPDLILTDYAMQGMDGRQLVEKLKGRAATAKIPVILMASRADISEKLKMLQDMVEDFLEKPFFIKEAAGRIKRIMDKISLEKMAREAPGESVVRGNLAQMNVMDLLQSLEMGHKTCELVLTTNGERCEMYFSDGQINHAIYGPLKGDEAVYKVLTWPGGAFQIDFTGKSSEQTITRSTQGLLMEGLRLLDEANREKEENVLDA